MMVLNENYMPPIAPPWHLPSLPNPVTVGDVDYGHLSRPVFHNSVNNCIDKLPTIVRLKDFGKTIVTEDIGYQAECNLLSTLLHEWK